MPRHEMELRNLPAFRIMEYLVEAGGTLSGSRTAAGEGWAAELREMEPVQFKVMTIPRDMLIIEGEDETQVERVYRFMRLKTMRGGG